MIDLTKLNWAAGFFEGEGTLRINKSANRPNSPWTMGFQIINTDLEALEKFKDGVCGIGKIYGPYGRSNTDRPRKPTYTWVSNSFADVVALTGLLYPLLSARRKLQILSTHFCVERRREWCAEQRL